MKFAAARDKLKHKEHNDQEELYDLIEKLLNRIEELENELNKSYDG